ncbi:hypothetical protein P1S61_26045 [Streptomyces sp. ME08-AFT2]|uniref:hypothetical protein n=1 Tax=Streptomyces sp. ME08-AFT2 TaxID=3028683 RepID=UPI0029A806F7|nr:hypothetical protein [Streptomyces sp. ME08-AFT2]MDX3312474.1 hypothetical protein [Streptomyces sp. ME08-AFT2]
MGESRGRPTAFRVPPARSMDVVLAGAPLIMSLSGSSGAARRCAMTTPAYRAKTQNMT